ncbi:MAG: hypothetical protein AAGJ81_12670 [Verrucomicrobiota bacterium]
MNACRAQARFLPVAVPALAPVGVCCPGALDHRHHAPVHLGNDAFGSLRSQGSGGTGSLLTATNATGVFERDRSDRRVDAEGVRVDAEGVKRKI